MNQSNKALRDKVAEVLEAVGEVMASQCDGATVESELGRKWDERINYSWEEGETFEYENVIEEAATKILALVTNHIEEKMPEKKIIGQSGLITEADLPAKNYKGGYNAAISEVQSILKEISNADQ